MWASTGGDRFARRRSAARRRGTIQMKNGIAAVLAAFAAAAQAGSEAPAFTSDGQLMFPADYREWVYLSSGIGMTYGPAAQADPANPRFDNVFVKPSAYRAFVETGKWPDKTVLILEIRQSVGKGSINKGGHYQSDVAAVEAAVKDESRF